MADSLKLKQRILKLGALCDKTKQWIKKEAKVEEPFDSIILAFIFIIAAYIPSLVLSLIMSCFIKEEKKLTYDPCLFTYSNPDTVDISKILKTVTQIQKNVTKLEEEGGMGGQG